jgi:hypothetical protein
MSVTLHEGWAIVTFADRPPVAGRLRYVYVGGDLHQWQLDVPPGDRHRGYTAGLDPLSVKSVTPCSEQEALTFAKLPETSRRRIVDSPNIEPPAA